MLRFAILSAVALCETLAFAAAPRVNVRDFHNPNAVVPLHENHEPTTELESHPRFRPAHYDVQHYDLSVYVDPTIGKVTGTTRMDLKVTSGSIAYVDVDAVDMQIYKVTNAAGTELTYDYDGKLLIAYLPQDLTRGEQESITIEYESLLPQSLVTTSGDVTNPQRMEAAYTYSEPEGSSAWFPCLDRPADKATMSIAVSVPSSYNALSNGDFLGFRQDSGVGTYRYRMDQPIATYLVSLVIGRYDVINLGSVHGKPLTLWAPPEIRTAAETETARTARMMEVFGQFTGTQYPFNSYAQSVAQAFKTSMEHQSATTLGGWRITGDTSGEGVLAHELAHQWFGDWVTCRTWGELWLNEGFASYLPYVFFEAEQQEARALGQNDYWRYGYFEESLVTAHPLSQQDPSMDAIFDGHAYEKGALVIHLMRDVANRIAPIVGGEEPLTRALRTYLAARGSNTATSQDLQAALEQTTGTSWQQFFDQWVRSAGHPVLNVTPVWENGSLTITVEQVQNTRANNPWRAFTFPLTLRFVQADGSVSEQTFDIYDDVQVLHARLSTEPAAVVADPEWRVPAEIDVQQGEAAWISAYKSTGASTRTRLIALRSLNKLLGSMPTQALLDLVLADGSEYLKVDALSAWTSRDDTRSQVSALRDNLRSMRGSDISTLGAIARAEAWLVRSSSSSPTRGQEALWQDRYISSPVVAERNALLGMLQFASTERAQTFAIERLQEPGWVTQDRSALIDLLTKTPTAASDAFIRNALKTASFIYKVQTVRNLLVAGYDRPAIVSTLIDEANHSPKIYLRSLMIDLMAQQVSSRSQVCPALDVLKTVGLSAANPETLLSVRNAARTAIARVGCTP